MSYRAGMDVRTARFLRQEPGEPRIVCDGCGLVRNITTGSKAPPAWFLDGKAPPGWRRSRPDGLLGGLRQDWCPTCKNKQEGTL
jgi:hypothetical protein